MRLAQQLMQRKNHWAAWLLTFGLLPAEGAYASLISVYKDEQGETNWQYLANTASGLLIILLTIGLITLFFSNRKAAKANRALKAIRNVLEQKVEERTATLNESNKLLKQANSLLQGEIVQHQETSALLRASETYIKNILESMPLMLIGLDRKMQITQWNANAERATGVSAQKALGANLWEAYPTITLSPAQIEAVLKSNKPQTIKHSQRGQYYFDITLYPLQDQLEPGLVVLVDDVTQRILAENMLIQRDKMSSMGELASTMAHDISIPLQAINRDMSDIRAAVTELDAPQQASIVTLLDDAVDAGLNAAKVIESLLAFSNDSGQKKRSVQLTEVVDQALELAVDVIALPGGLKFKDIQVEQNYETALPDLPCYVAELQQVFLSLFRHACHALDGLSKPQIAIEVVEHYGAIWVKVQHNGKGLTASEQQYIFEPFFNNQSDEKGYDFTKRLSFSYFIVTEHHQGQMAVTSDVNVGTTFHLQLEL